VFHFSVTPCLFTNSAIVPTDVGVNSSRCVVLTVITEYVIYYKMVKYLMNVFDMWP
jgi:hypothetical protein